MNKPIDCTASLLKKAGEDPAFRKRLLENPRQALEEEYGVSLPEEHAVYVHEETSTDTHLVLPPRDRYSPAEREEARTGATSLAFLRKTMHDPAPPRRLPAPSRTNAVSGEDLVSVGRESIRRSLAFLQSTIDESGAWHCIRFNVADPDIPRHFERPPFISALCVLALENCKDARALCDATRAYLAQTMEYPGLWRYYRHLPLDLDSTALCSLIIDTHPWIVLRRNVAQILANRDANGRFLTWVLGDDEPDVVKKFRIEADPVVNANVIAYLGDCPQTRDAQHWLETLVREDRLKDSSKWYPDTVTIYYAITRAMLLARPALESLRPVLADRILGLRDAQGEFGNLIQSAQAVTALADLDSLERIDVKRLAQWFINCQHEDGSWPELLAFGDQSLRFGTVGQIGHGAEAVTSVFCIEALGHLLDALAPDGT